jgi:hypothetical protein
MRRTSSGSSSLAAVAVSAALCLGLAATPRNVDARSAATGTLAVRAEIHWKGDDAECPAGMPITAECHPHPGGPTLVPGLGEVRQEYLYPIVAAPAAACRANGGFNVADYSARLIVKGKGEIVVAVAGTDECLFGPASDTVVKITRPYTVTGGAGAYVGASGSGTVAVDGHFSPSYGHAVGIDTWTGTLVVPGLEFDLTPPALSAPAAKTVRVPKRVKRARVSYAASARDDVDGAVPVSCKPKSGSRFKLGRTVVRCSAADTSGNAAAASFTVTVKRR